MVRTKFLPGTGRGTMRSMVEGSARPLILSARDGRVACPSTGFAGPPPRAGEEF